MERPSTTIRQLGALSIALGLAIGALGLPSWPFVAWSLSLGLNLLAAIAVLRLVGGMVARRAPFAAAAGGGDPDRRLRARPDAGAVAGVARRR